MEENGIVKEILWTNPGGQENCVVEIGSGYSSLVTYA